MRKRRGSWTAASETIASEGDSQERALTPPSRRRSSISSLLPWFGDDDSGAVLAAATRSIDQDQCSVSSDHLAYDHLNNMRGWGLAANVIDSMGNFVDEPGEAASVSNGPEAKEGSPPPTVPTLFEGQPSCLGATLLGDRVSDVTM